MTMSTTPVATVNGRHIYTALSTDTKTTSGINEGSWCNETDTNNTYELKGGVWVQKSTGGAAHTFDVFVPSSYDTDLTMNDTAQGVVLATGATKVQFANRGATTEAIRVAFGTSELDAEGNLNIAAGAATTGYYIPAAADGGSQSVIVLGVPSDATHYAVANAVASDVQTVSVTQGV